MKQKIQFIVGLFVFVLAIVGISFINKPQALGGLRVYFFDVGQGDAAYIRTPSGEDILIDGGPDNSILDNLGQVMPFSDREINLVILSHPHADHLAGLIEVLKRYEVDEVWQTGVEYPAAGYATFNDEISRQGISNRFVKRGDSKEFGEVEISVLYPLASLDGKTIDNLNNASIVNKLDYQDFSVLFTGDAEILTQKELLSDSADDLFVDILKVAHHGSSNGMLEDFLKVVRPSAAVISVGKDNKYGHPSQAILNLLKNYAVRILRTDQNGTIEISSDGEGYAVRTDL